MCVTRAQAETFVEIKPTKKEKEKRAKKNGSMKSWQETFVYIIFRQTLFFVPLRNQFDGIHIHTHSLIIHWKMFQLASMWGKTEFLYDFIELCFSFTILFGRHWNISFSNKGETKETDDHSTFSICLITNFVITNHLLRLLFSFRRN